MSSYYTTAKSSFISNLIPSTTPPLSAKSELSKLQQKESSKIIEPSRSRSLPNLLASNVGAVIEHVENYATVETQESVKKGHTASVTGFRPFRDDIHYFIQAPPFLKISQSDTYVNEIDNERRFKPYGTEPKYPVRPTQKAVPLTSPQVGTVTVTGWLSRLVSDTPISEDQGSIPKIPGQDAVQRKRKLLVNSSWDGDPLVTPKLVNKIQNQETKESANRLIQYPNNEKNVATNDLRMFHNPLYYQSAYGAYGVAGDKNEKRLKENISIPVPTVPPGMEKYFLFGKEAYQHYLSSKTYLDKIEKDKTTPQFQLLRKRLLEKRENIAEVVHTAREFYTQSEPLRSQSIRDRFTRVKDYLSGKNIQKGFSDHRLRESLIDNPLYTPWLTYILLLIQAIAIAILCSSSGITRVTFTQRRTQAESIKTWNGDAVLEHFTLPNMWIGPEPQDLVIAGALLAGCVRSDKAFLLRKAHYRDQREHLGCCETINGAGTTTEEQCMDIKYEFELKDTIWLNLTCAQREPNIQEVLVRHEFKPCCYNIEHECILASYTHCVFLGGVWDIGDVEHCSQAECVDDVCHAAHRSSVKFHDAEYAHNAQAWRIIVSLVYHYGIIHAVVNTAQIYFVCKDVEMIQGWFRTSLIYLICGVISLIFGSAITPKVPVVGSGGSIMGLIGYETVELVNTWSLLDKKRQPFHVLRILVLFFFNFLLGLFPGVNQFTNLSGFVLGVFCTFAFMKILPRNPSLSPRIYIGLRVSGFAGILMTLLVAILIFNHIQPNNIGGFKYINCLSFIKYACDENLP